jgi:hypothetical protein
VIDQIGLDNAVRQWLNYREGLRSAQALQANGFEVPNTKMSEFKASIDQFSRRAISAVGENDENYLEAMGELLLNAVHNIRQQRKDPTFLW